MDLNAAPRPKCTYTLGMQTEWQLQVMAKYGNGSGLSFDATFGTNTPRVCHPTISALCTLYCSPVHAFMCATGTVVGTKCPLCTVPLLHCDGVRRVAQRSTSCLCHHEQVLGGEHSCLVTRIAPQSSVY
jgi:hypothetical protein